MCVQMNVQPKSTLYMNHLTVFKHIQTIVFPLKHKRGIAFHTIKCPFLSLVIGSVVYTLKIFLQFFLFQKLNLRCDSSSAQIICLLINLDHANSGIWLIWQKLECAICWFKIKLFAQVLHSNILYDPSEIIHSICNQLRGARGVAVQS